MSLMKIKTSGETAAANVGIDMLLNQDGGFEKLAMEELPPFIRETRDYNSFGREILVTHNVTSEDIVRIDNEDYVSYNKDLNSHAAFFAVDPEIPRNQIEGDNVNVPIGILASDENTISIKRLMTQKLNYLMRVQKLAGEAIAQLEDSRVLGCIELLLLGNSSDRKKPENEEQIATTADIELSKKHLVQLKKKLSAHDVPLSAFVMNPSTQDDILTWATAEIDQLTQREILESGAKYSLWGNVRIVTSRIVPVNFVYAFAEKEYVGRMPILKDITVKLTETKNRLEKGLFMYEFLGIYLASHKAVAKLILGFEEGGDKVSPEFLTDEMMARDTTKPVNDLGARETQVNLSVDKE